MAFLNPHIVARPASGSLVIKAMISLRSGSTMAPKTALGLRPGKKNCLTAVDHETSCMLLNPEMIACIPNVVCILNL